MIENTIEASEITVLSDSHHAQLARFWTTHGVKLNSIKGATIPDLMEFSNHVVASIYILQVGSNDLEKTDGYTVAQTLTQLVIKLANRTYTKAVVTERIIPRDSGSNYVTNYKIFVQNFRRCHYKHHAIGTDMFLDTDRQQIDKTVYHRDKTHLNTKGLDEYSIVLDWVISSINNNASGGWSRPIVRARNNRPPDSYHARWLY